MRKKAVTTEMMMGYIAEALFRLMERKPFAEITIQEIAEKAGVNRCTYYRHFKSKEAILSWFLDRMMEDYAAQADRSLERRKYFESMFQFFERYRAELLLLWDNGLSTLLLEVLQRRLKPSVPVDGTILEQYTAAYHVGGVFNHLLLWFSRGMCDSPAEMANIVMTIIPTDFEPFLLRSQRI